MSHHKNANFQRFMNVRLCFKSVCECHAQVRASQYMFQTLDSSFFAWDNLYFSRLLKHPLRLSTCINRREFMIIATQSVVQTLSDYAYQKVQKYFKKTLKWEKIVKRDEDPEALRKMRIALRCLQSVINGFEFALILPKAVANCHISKIARRLGNVRYLDKLKESLEKIQPYLPPQEVQYLEKAFHIVNFQREQALADIQSTLTDARYQVLKYSLSCWLEEPMYEKSALYSIDVALPDLLLPKVSKYLLHPGWQFGMSQGNNVLNSTTLLRSYLRGMTKNQIEQSLNPSYKVLHSLRKQAKNLRYQMELFTEFYGESYKEHLTQVKNIQDMLGKIHSNDILVDWLIDVFGENFAIHLPTFTSLLVDKRHQLWQQWVLIQRHHTDSDTRNKLHLVILNPVVA
jgi:CHAD domain-containing protein